MDHRFFRYSFRYINDNMIMIYSNMIYMYINIFIYKDYNDI